MANNYKNVISSKKAEAKKLMTDDQILKCNVAIHTASAAAGAESFIPIPGVDAVPISATQITMIIALGKIFNQKVSESAAKAVIGATASTFVGRSLVKLIPVAGWVASAAVAAGVTEAIGWTAAVDFANQASKMRQPEGEVIDHVVSDEDIVYGEDISHMTMDEMGNWDESDENASDDDKFVEKNRADVIDKTDCSAEEIQYESAGDSSEKCVEDDESISNDFSKLFGEDDE